LLKWQEQLRSLDIEIELSEKKDWPPEKLPMVSVKAAPTVILDIFSGKTPPSAAAIKITDLEFRFNADFCAFFQRWICDFLYAFFRRDCTAIEESAITELLDEQGIARRARPEMVDPLEKKLAEEYETVCRVGGDQSMMETINLFEVRSDIRGLLNLLGFYQSVREKIRTFFPQFSSFLTFLEKQTTALTHDKLIGNLNTESIDEEDPDPRRTMAKRIVLYRRTTHLLVQLHRNLDDNYEAGLKELARFLLSMFRYLFFDETHGNAEKDLAAMLDALHLRDKVVTPYPHAEPLRDYDNQVIVMEEIERMIAAHRKRLFPLEGLS